MILNQHKSLDFVLIFIDIRLTKSSLRSIGSWERLLPDQTSVRGHNTAHSRVSYMPTAKAWVEPLKWKSNHKTTAYSDSSIASHWSRSPDLRGHREPHRVTITAHSDINTCECLRIHLLLWKWKSINIDNSFHKERAIIKNPNLFFLVVKSI